MLEYVCVLDFEATCDKGSKDHEIIEFPSVLLRWSDEHELCEVSRIQLFVRPKVRPVVSTFCHELTGITQQQVDAGLPLPQALDAHQAWLLAQIAPHALHNVLLMTCGTWDLVEMLPRDLRNFGLTPSSFYRRFVNLKDLFFRVLPRRGRLGMPDMLSALGLELLGRHHSGLDDCVNIGRIFVELVKTKGLRKRDVLHFAQLAPGR